MAPSQASLLPALAVLAAIAVGAGAAVGHVALTLLSGLGNLLGGAVLVPLFSRIGGDRMLENEVRQRLHEAIEQDPGLSMGVLRDRTGVAWGTAVYHLHRMERTGLVVSLRQGGYRRYFSPHASSRHRSHIAVLSHPTAQRIALFVHGHPGTDQGSVCRELGLLHPAASKHLGRFETLGLVTAQRAGRSRLYHPTQDMQVALNLVEPAASPAPAAPAE
jgi:predicted transcriptional regulator